LPAACIMEPIDWYRLSETISICFPLAIVFYWILVRNFKWVAFGPYKFNVRMPLLFLTYRFGYIQLNICFEYSYFIRALILFYWCISCTSLHGMGSSNCLYTINRPRSIIHRNRELLLSVDGKFYFRFGSFWKNL